VVQMLIGMQKRSYPIKGCQGIWLIVVLESGAPEESKRRSKGERAKSE
jgi:hypothetical protein